MASTALSTRRATMADVPMLTRMLARAYHDDPVALWFCGSNELRSTVLERIYRARLCQLLVHREIWTTADHSSVAVWLPPGCAKTNLSHEFAVVRCFLHPRLIARLPLLGIGSIAMQRKHPHTPPHWYLSLLGTDPDARGRGLGSAVLRPVLDRCDAEGVGVYLESSKERNIGFYARCGFRVVEEFRMPRGPSMWPMWREPAGGL